ncbi:hypothetical protein XENOCAPTIV_018388, partial [Xenoophorus captivus]
DSDIKFEPDLRAYEKVLVSVFELMLRSTRSIPRIETTLFPDWVRITFLMTRDTVSVKPEFISNFTSSQEESHLGKTLKPIILPEIIQPQQEEVCRAFWAETDRPKEYIRQYDQYAMLMSRQAEEKVEQFLSQRRSFQDIMEEAIRYQQLADEIQYTPCKVRSVT